MALTLRLLFYNVQRTLCTTSKHVANSNSNMKETNESVTKDWKVELHNTMKILPDFISKKEEDVLVREVDPYMKQLRYEYSHWDNVSKLLIMLITEIAISRLCYFNLFTGNTRL